MIRSCGTSSGWSSFTAKVARLTEAKSDSARLAMYRFGPSATVETCPKPCPETPQF